MKVLHCADWHLRDEDIEEAEKCLSFLTETARKEVVDLIIIAGDVFDSRDIKLDSKAARLAIKTVSELADIAPVAVVLGTPSHDGSAPEILRYTKGDHAVHVASMPGQIYLAAGDLVFEDSLEGYPPDAVITLIPQPTKQFFQTNSDIKAADQEIGAALSNVFAGFGAMAADYDCPHILVYHGGISGAKMSNGQTLTGQEIEVSIEQLNLTGADLHCCGHIHLPQQAGERTFYSGSIYAKDWGENHKHGFYIHVAGRGYTLTEEKKQTVCESVFIETPTRKMVRLQHNFVECPPLDELDVVLYSLDREEVDNAVIRCDFTVYQEEAATIDKEMIKNFYMSAGAVEVDVRIIRVPRETVRSETVLKVETLREKLIAMAEIKGETVLKSILEKADILEEVSPESLIASMLNEKVEVAA